MEHTVVHIPEDILSRRGPRATPKVRIVVTSDTHNSHDQLGSSIPDGDIFIHAGDFTNKGKLEEVVAFGAWMDGLPHAHKILVTGNHDVGVFTEFQPKLAATHFPLLTFLETDVVNIMGISFYGNPWHRKGVCKIPEGVDVLVTHEPPMGILDGGHGNEYFAKRISQLSDPPLVHVFGHVHEAVGCQRTSTTFYVNAAAASAGMTPKCLVTGCFVFDI